MTECNRGDGLLMSSRASRIPDARWRVMVGDLELFANNSLIPFSNRFGSLGIVASAKASGLSDEAVVHTTGMREPEARIKKAILSLLSTGTEWPRMTRSKSPSLKRLIASLIDHVDVTT
jgi:hypothetical protein